MMLIQSCSSFPRLQHEPLNPDRALGRLTSEFVRNSDRQVLQTALRKALVDRPNIKHCIDTVPVPVTEVLVRVCVALDYRFLLWSRKNLAERLTSLFIAQQTELWGTEGRNKLVEAVKSGKKELLPFDLEAVRQQAQRDRQSWNEIASLLRQLNADHVESTYEHIYGEQNQKTKRTISLLQSLGLNVSADDKRIQDFAAQAPVGSSTLMHSVPNITQVQTMLQSLDGG